MSFRSKFLQAFALLPVALAFLASTSSAGAVTLGTNNASAASVTGCNDPYTWIQRATAPTTPSYRAPSAGTITSWTTSAGPGGSTAALKIWRPTSNPLEFTPVAQSATESVPAGDTLQTFSTSIHVQKGDVLGVAVITGLLRCYYPDPAAKTGDVASSLYGDPSSGTQSFTDCLGASCLGATATRLNLSVNFSAAKCVVPKLKGETLAAAKDALADANCGLGTVTKKESTGKAGIVLSQTPQPGKKLPAGSHVALVVSTA